MGVILKLLDLFCGAGGAARGYTDAGFEVVGVDHHPQPRFPYEFIQADALDFLNQADLTEFNLISASPPCQLFSFGSRRWDTPHVDLIAPTRFLLDQRSVDYVIENVVGAPLICPIQLDGQMFGLGVLRRRLFEANWPLSSPTKVRKLKRIDKGQMSTVAGHGGHGPRNMITWSLAMGIDWMSEAEITQAIPPAYTKYIGKQYIQWIS